MQCGTPSVTTSIGAEAMYAHLSWNGFIEENPVVFADKAVQLYQEKKLWLVAQKKGTEIIKQRYLRSLFVADFKEQINFLQYNLQQHRLNNFMGQLLQHHTLKSTKYMSKWIETKNKV